MCLLMAVIWVESINFVFFMFNHGSASSMFTQVFHSDYFSGWDEDKLQHVLENCENDSEAAMPTAFCNDFLTFIQRKGEAGGDPGG